MKPFIFAACDDAYYHYFAKALINSARVHGHECEVANGGVISRGSAAALRYIKLPGMLQKHPSILILDVDSIINGPIEIGDRFDLGVFLRNEYTDRRKKIMGSAVYVTDRAMQFATELKDYLSNDPQWFADQFWLYKLYERHKEKYTIKHFDTNFINWHFHPAPIWTGKGEAKDTENFKREMQRYA